MVVQITNLLTNIYYTRGRVGWGNVHRDDHTAPPLDIQPAAGLSLPPSPHLCIYVYRSASIHQQISKKIFFDADASYSTEPETSIVASTNLPAFFFGTPPRSTQQQVRNDTITSFRLSLTYNLVERASYSAFYAISDNSSGQANFAYISHQVGLSLNYRY